MSQKERIVYMLIQLLGKDDYVTIESFSKHLMVSRGTIINDMAEMKKWLSENNIIFETAKGHGIKVSGKEIELRRAIIKLLCQDNDKLNLFNMNIMSFFKNMDINFIKESIRTAEKQMESTFSDDAFNSLVIHILLAIKRIQLSKDIIMDKTELKNLRKTAEFAIASVIARMIEDKFKLIVPEDEIGYITIHLLGSNIKSDKNNEKDDWVHVQLITLNLVEEAESKTGYGFKYDNQLFEGLMQHLRPALFRLKNNLVAKNPMLAEIKKNYKDMFNAVKICVKFIENENEKTFNEDEIGYLTLHFMASLERSKKSKFEKPNVLVVCASGIGTSEFVSTKLKSIFDVNIIDTISSRDVDKVIKENDTDLIVTTIPLDIKGIKCIEVNPFLTEKNISDLSLYFARFDSNLKFRKEETNKNKYENILKIIKENCSINNYTGLKSKLAEFFNMQEIINENYRPSLKDLIDENSVRFNEEAENWEEAVRKSGEILKETGCITDKYIEAMIETVKNIGPYMVILPGIAMPHAKPEDGALKIGFGILVLKKPVIFGNEENDPVKLVISLSAVDNVSHMNALKELMKIIDHYEFMKKLNKAESAKEVAKLLGSPGEEDTGSCGQTFGS